MADFEKMLREHAAAFSSQDPEQVISLYTDDGVYEDVPLGSISRGKEEIKRFLSGTFASIPDFTVNLTSVFVAGNWSAREWLVSGTYTKSGKRFSIRGASIAEFQGGKISRNSDYWDLKSYLQQVS